MATRLEHEAFQFFEENRAAGKALSTDPQLIRKLGEEFGELAEAIANGDDKAAYLEAADLHLILIDFMARKWESLSVHTAVKLDMLRTRWAS